MPEPSLIERLWRLSRELNLAETRLRTCQLASRAARDLFAADRGSVALVEDGQMVVRAISDDVDTSSLNTRSPIEGNSVGEVLSNAAPRRWAKLSGKRTDQAIAKQLGLRVVMAAPLVTSASVVGTLQVGRREETPFSGADLELLAHVALLVAAALQRVELLAKVAARKAAVEACAAATARLAAASRELAAAADLEAVRQAARSAAADLFTRAALLWREDGRWRDLVAGTDVAAGDIGDCLEALESGDARQLLHLGDSSDRVLAHLFAAGATAAALASFAAGEIAAVVVAATPGQLPLSSLQTCDLLMQLVAAAVRRLA